jgi:hypothetical protein
LIVILDLAPTLSNLHPHDRDDRPWAVSRHICEGFKQFKQLGSYKSRNLYGNIQITLFEHQGRYLADLDIDNAGGILHVFQVLRNAITGRPTHPYDSREILGGYQHIDPGYALVV